MSKQYNLTTDNTTEKDIEGIPNDNLLKDLVVGWKISYKQLLEVAKEGQNMKRLGDESEKQQNWILAFTYYTCALQMLLWSSKSAKEGLQSVLSKDQPSFEQRYKDNKTNIIGQYYGVYFTIMKAVENDVSALQKKLWQLSAFISENYNPVNAPLSSTISSTGKTASKSEESDTDPCNKYEYEQFVKGSENCNYWAEDIIGEQAKDAYKQLENYIKQPLLYPGLYGKPAKGILLYGPPGTGKTLLVKTAVNELNRIPEGQKDRNVRILFYAVTPGELKSRYFGDSEKAIRNAFQCAAQVAKDYSTKFKIPTLAIIFLDEIDSIAGQRSSDDALSKVTVNALLQEMDGIGSSSMVSVIGATNDPWSLDDAILSRFDKQILISNPSKDDIVKQLDYNINKFIQTGLSTRSFPKDSMMKDLRLIIEDNKKGKFEKVEKKKVTDNIDLCSPPESSLSVDWKSVLFKDFVPNLTPRDIESIARLLRGLGDDDDEDNVMFQKSGFSGRTISKIFSDVIILAAEKAQMNSGAIVKQLSPQDTGKELFISIQSVPKESWTGIPKKDITFLSKPNDIALWYKSGNDVYELSYYEPFFDPPKTSGIMYVNVNIHGDDYFSSEHPQLKATTKHVVALYQTYKTLITYDQYKEFIEMKKVGRYFIILVEQILGLPTISSYTEVEKEWIQKTNNQNFIKDIRNILSNTFMEKQARLPVQRLITDLYSIPTTFITTDLKETLANELRIQRKGLYAFATFKVLLEHKIEITASDTKMTSEETQKLRSQLIDGVDINELPKFGVRQILKQMFRSASIIENRLLLDTFRGPGYKRVERIFLEYQIPPLNYRVQSGSLYSWLGLSGNTIKNFSDIEKMTPLQKLKVLDGIFDYLKDKADMNHLSTALNLCVYIPYVPSQGETIGENDYVSYVGSSSSIKFKELTKFLSDLHLTQSYLFPFNDEDELLHKKLTSFGFIKKVDETNKVIVYNILPEFKTFPPEKGTSKSETQSSFNQQDQQVISYFALNFNLYGEDFLTAIQSQESQRTKPLKTILYDIYKNNYLTLEEIKDIVSSKDVKSNLTSKLNNNTTLLTKYGLTPK